ncbi:type II toxin-antitoxin system RelE/ParE family toxin [Candidatus Sumerlaeota bacterium]|nr:type II toxin-antitoxin system RelE/ParE family toxin [Candidatus Sumerlaeota bacterium]
MKQIVFHPDAEVEIIDAAQYYEAHKSGLGSDFLGEVEQALDYISTNPEASPLIGRRSRRKILWRFPYNLIYAVYPDRIRIVACAHQKRRPFYWRKRLDYTDEQ